MARPSVRRERFSAGYLASELERLRTISDEHLDSLSSLEGLRAAKDRVFGSSLSESRGIDDSRATLAVCQVPTSAITSGQLSFLELILKNEAAAVSRVNIAEAIVFAGHSNVLNCRQSKRVREIVQRPNFVDESHDLSGDAVGIDADLESKVTNSALFLSAPVLTIGNLVTVDRHEMECIRSVRNLMANYMRHSILQPLSIAVFGRPGSGKSFAVKSIARDLEEYFGRQCQLSFLEFNLAQFDDVHDLANAIREVQNENLQFRLPVVFFDEFDCNSETELGWLKFFLAPMQDGKFKMGHQLMHIGKAILVFAGGRTSSYSAFQRLVGDSMNSGAKGSDFISRLRGFVDVPSINQRVVNGKKLDKPVIRRSILLRSLLRGMGLTEEHDGGLSIAGIDEDVVYAMLTIDKYVHEARSMQAILSMCTTLEGRIEKASLPSDGFLGMHVNAREFRDRMYRSRKRQPVWLPSQ